MALIEIRNVTRSLGVFAVLDLLGMASIILAQITFFASGAVDKAKEV